MGKIIVKEAKSPTSRIAIGWYVVWFLAATLFVLFLIEPTWFALPPWIHGFKQ